MNVGEVAGMKRVAMEYSPNCAIPYVSRVDAGTIGTGPDNGFDGEYGGFSRRTSLNAGTATVQGWELSYQQQFTFLPGLLKGLSGSANYTLLDTHGDFGGTGHVLGAEE